MKVRNLVIGLASGAAAGYVAIRAIEAFDVVRSRNRTIEQKRTDATQYGRARRALAVSDVVRATASGLAFAYGPLGANLARRVEALPRWARPACFAALASAGGAILELPVSIAEGFRIERRYGLSEQSLESYVGDWAKSTAIEAALSAILATLGVAILRRFPRAWPLVGMMTAFPLYVLANIIVPLYILPLFNKFETLDGPLETRLRALASRFGVGDAEILRMDMSRQTRKANAFVTGIGTTHRIVLGDTLIDNFTSDEVEFVIAHELGHYVTRDTWRLIVAAEVATAALLVAAALIERSRDADETLRVVRIAALLGAGLQVVRPALAGFSRSREWAADRFALATTMNSQAGASAFRRLRDQNLAEEAVPAWYEFFFATHPSLGKRIAELEEV